MGFSGGFGPAAVASVAERREAAARARVEVRKKKSIAESIAREVLGSEVIEALTGTAGAVIALGLFLDPWDRSDLPVRRRRGGRGPQRPHGRRLPRGGRPP